MTKEEMDRLLERHFAAQQRRDVEGVLATYTDDVEHDAVGRDPNPLHGKTAAGAFYRESLPDLEHTKILPIRPLYGDDFAMDESLVDRCGHRRPFGMEGDTR